MHPLEFADQAAKLGFTDLGVTGGGIFLRREMPGLLVALSRRLPVVALANATLNIRCA